MIHDRELKIGYFADGPWAHRALEKISSDPDLRVLFIVPRYDHQDPVLLGRAGELGAPFLPDPNVNSDHFIQRVSEFQADLFVSMSFNQIIKPRLYGIPRLGFINCHAGALPFYRGRNVLNWALINGEARFGVSVHYIDSGIDTGDLIRQDWVPIEPSDDYSNVLEKAQVQCAESLYSAIKDLAMGRAHRRPQSEIHETGFYCGIRRPGDEYLDWNWSTERLHNFIRGIAPPGPGARSFRDVAEFAILKSEKIPDAPVYIGTIGEVVGRTSEGGSLVKTGDSTLIIWRIDDVTKEGALAGNARPPGFRLGTRLGR